MYAVCSFIRYTSGELFSFHTKAQSESQNYISKCLQTSMSPSIVQGRQLTLQLPRHKQVLGRLLLLLCSFSQVLLPRISSEHKDNQS